MKLSKFETKFCENLQKESGDVQRNANLVDLEICCKMSLYAPVGGKKRPAYFVPQKKSFVSRASARS